MLNSLGSGDKAQYQPLVEGLWELVWTPSSSERLTVQPDAALGDTGSRLMTAEISPVSAKDSLQLPTLWEGYKTLELFDWQLVGVRLKDGTELNNIFVPPTQEGYADIDNLIFKLSYASHQILEPDQADAPVLAPRTLTGGEQIVIPIG